MQCHQNTNYPVFISRQGLVVSSIIIGISCRFIIGVIHLSAILFLNYLSGVLLLLVNLLSLFQRVSGTVIFQPLCEVGKLVQRMLHFIEDQFPIFVTMYIILYFLQSLTEHLRQTLVFMWNNTLWEKIYFYFPRDFS